MDFFQFANYFLDIMFMSSSANPANKLWICMLVGSLCFLIVYIFLVCGLWTIAKRERLPHKWMIFIPFVNTYYIGVCSQKNNVYNIKSRHFAIATAVFEAVLAAGFVLYFVSAFAMWDYIEWRPEFYGETIAYYVPDTLVGVPESMQWLAWIFANLRFILSLVDIVYVVLKLLLLTAFFRTYAARQYLLFSIVGAILPLAGILVYAVRNNKGMNYMDYLRQVRERNYRMYQQQYGNPYNQNPYNGQGGYNNQGGYNGGYNNGYNGGYNNNGYGGQGPSQGSSAPDPFDEYGSSSKSSGDSSYGGNSGGSGNANGGNSGGGNSSSGGSPFDDFN